MITQSQGFALAKNAGLSDDRAKIAAALMMAESGGNEKVIVNDSDDYSFGLWQINMKGSMGPTRRALYGLASNEALLDPKTNARVMSAISNQGQNFTAWGAFTNGSYRQFLGTPIKDVDLPIPGPGGTIVNGLLDFLPDSVPGVGTSVAVIDTIAKYGAAMTKTAAWVSNPRNWVRVAYVIGGAGLIYAAVQAIILPNATKVVGKVSGIVGPGGKVSKVANKIGAK